MGIHYRQMKFDPNLDSGSTRALIVSGLWLRAGFVGASALLGGLVLLFTGDASATFALVCAIAGGALALFAFRRSRAALHPADASTAGHSVPERRRELIYPVELPLSR